MSKGTLSDAAAPTTCTPGSQQCFELCGSPSCFSPEDGGSIPALEQTPGIYIPDGDGGSAPDACAQIRAESLAIRQRSCAQCHTNLKQGGFDYVTDDVKLASQSSQNYMNPTTNMMWRMVVPGDPTSSWLYQRIAQGSMPPPQAAVNAILGTKVGATVMATTASDQSVLHSWIVNCIAGATGDAYAITKYGPGGPYGPDAGAGAAGAGGGAQP